MSPNEKNWVFTLNHLGEAVFSWERFDVSKKYLRASRPSPMGMAVLGNIIMSVLKKSLSCLEKLKSAYSGLSSCFNGEDLMKGAKRL